MMFKWLKRYVPRGLYSRAALILILPVVTLQLVVTVVFIQRHFSGVTTQMTETTAREIQLLVNLPLAERPPLAEALQIAVLDVPVAEVPEKHQRRWYDLTGLVVIDRLENKLPGVMAIDLPDDHNVRLFLRDAGNITALHFDRQRVSATNAHQLFVNMVFFGGLMTLIAYIYLRNQLRPITRLAQAAEAFGKGRSIAYRPAGALEVRAAGHAFVDMRSRIERHIQQRTLMLSGVSHDLRTPLTRLKLGLAFIDSEERAAMEQDVDDMQKMLDGFLSFSQGASDGDPEPVAVLPMVEKIVADMKRAEVLVTLGEMEGDPSVQVPLRPMAIQRAITNLIENGTRYGTHVRVSARLSDRSLRIRIEDDGPGIPPEQRQDALKPFTRLDAARNQNKATGVGLGLAIANDTARAHGGVLRLSQSADMGGLQVDLVIGL